MDDKLQDSPSTSFISPRNRSVLLRYMEGQSIEQIAQVVHLPVEKVRAVLQLRAVKQEILRLGQLTNDEWLKDRLTGLAQEALDVIRDTMRGEQSSDLRYKAAAALLDKNPVLRAATQGSLSKELGVGIGEAIINRLAELEGAARAQADEIDVTPRTLVEEGNTHNEE